MPRQSENSSKSVQLLIEYISHSPEYERLVREAKEKVAGKDSLAEEKTGSVEKVLSVSSDLLFAKPREFNGRAIVSEELDEHAKITARVVTVSNSIDFCFNLPFFFYAFGFLGSVPSGIISLAISLGVLRFGNDTAAAVASRKSSNRFWSSAAILGLVVLNVVQSIASGIGTELFGNQKALSQLHAGSEVEKRISFEEASIERLKVPDSAEYKKAKEICEDGDYKLAGLEQDDPEWDRIYVQLYGTWKQQEQGFSNVPTESLPACPKEDRLLAQAAQSPAYLQAKEQLAATQNQRAAIGNDVLFLKRYYSVIYEEHFDGAGDLLSGIEAVRWATLNFLEKLHNREFAALGFPLFIFSVSAITSLVACLMTTFHAFSPETQRSRSPLLTRARDEWLHHQLDDLLTMHEQERMALEESFNAGERGGWR